MGKSINLRDAAKYYKELPGQQSAFDYLQQNTPIHILEGFANLYRDNPVVKPEFYAEHPITKKILKRILDLGIKLQKPPEGYRAYVVGIEGCNTDLTTNDDQLDAWNDAIGVLMVYDEGPVRLFGLFPGTTEPGKYYTQNVMNKEGSARVVTDRLHKDIWQVGTHIRQPNCLVQTGAPIAVVRDSNRDGKRGSNEKIREGFYGINFHHAQDRYNPYSIGKWSAGCCVIPKTESHQSCMGIVKRSYDYGRNKAAKFSYILLDGSKL